jgi:hypothetical protein
VLRATQSKILRLPALNSTLENPDALPGALAKLLGRILPAVDRAIARCGAKKSDELLRICSVENVIQLVRN